MAVDEQRARELRDSAERIILRATRRAMRAYLDSIRKATLAGIARLPEEGLTAALTDPIPEPVERFAPGEVPLLGNSAGRWAALVDEHITDTVARTFSRVYEEFATKGLVLTSPALSGMEAFNNKVRDRLVRGTHFGVTVYEDSFDQVRTALARSVTEGWTRSELSQRIAASLSWETDGSYWRGVQAGVDGKIDAILDALGPPGHPAREYARLNDPLVQLLRNERNIAIRHLDAERSIWQTRAMLIARTESTSVANYGALAALISEGWTHKEWVSTLDPRTRDSHAQANGQVVKIDEEFRVGDEKLAFPGDPSATVGEVANCRCALIGAAAPVTTTTTTAKPLTKAQIRKARAEAVKVSPQSIRGMNFLDEPEGVMASLAKANTPHYQSLSDVLPMGLKGNCQKTTAAFELRQRGLDVVASLGQGGHMRYGGFNSWFGITKKDVNAMRFFKKRGDTYENITKVILESHPAGSRGALTVVWKQGNGAHIFNWQVDDLGVLKFFDAQTGKVVDVSSRYWSAIDWSPGAHIVRLDDKTFRASGARAILNPQMAESTLRTKVGPYIEVMGELQSTRDELAGVVDKLKDLQQAGRLFTEEGRSLRRQREALEETLGRLHQRSGRLSPITTELGPEIVK